LRQSNLVYTSFRSQNDAENWKTNFQLGVNDIVRDPALLSHQVYGIDLAAKKQALLARKRKIVGVNVMSDNLVKRESSTPQSIPSNTEIFLRLGQLLVEAGYDVCYFTNGSSDDEKVKEHIESMISPEMAKRVTFKDKLSTPTALVQTISNLDCLVAHRLHANIISYSLQIPHIGLGWSLKVKDFFQSVDREPFFLPSENLTAELILDTIEQAIHQGIPEEKHRAVIQQTQHGLDQLTANLSSST
jgi:polysaccharide pyruvyl transferase WcaK-like protein